MIRPRKYRKKPVEVEAIQWDGTDSGAYDVMAWIDPAVKCHHFPPGTWSSEHPDAAYITIATLEGDILASPGDYVIRGVQGEYYPCKPDIFAATYDEVRR